MINEIYLDIIVQVSGPASPGPGTTGTAAFSTIELLEAPAATSLELDATIEPAADELKQTLNKDSKFSQRGVFLFELNLAISIKVIKGISSISIENRKIKKFYLKKKRKYLFFYGR